MSKNFKEILRKYIPAREPFHIRSYNNLTQLYEIEDVFVESGDLVGRDDEQWRKLVGWEELIGKENLASSGPYGCMRATIADQIETLGGKSYNERKAEREREREQKWQTEITQFFLGFRPTLSKGEYWKDRLQS